MKSLAKVEVVVGVFSMISFTHKYSLELLIRV